MVRTRIALTLALLAQSRMATAACLQGHPSVEQEYAHSYGVVVGHVVAEQGVPESDGYYDGVEYRVKIDEVFHGDVPQTIRLFSENSSGRFPMRIGKKYLLFIYRERDRTMVDNCGNSRLLEGAEALREVQRLSQRRESH